MKNNIIFLSHKYTRQTPSYGNRDMVKISSNSSIGLGETANSSCWVFTNNHIGTHVDVPFHFSENGKRVGEYDAGNWFFSNVELIDIVCDKAKLININDIEKHSINSNIELLLIRTTYEKYRGEEKYWNDNPGLTPSLAKYLRNKFPKLRCIGFDFISITSWKFKKEGRESHKAFLSPGVNEKPIMAIEDMSLKYVNNKIEWIVAAPIIVEEGNGAPVTIIANLR